MNHDLELEAKAVKWGKADSEAGDCVRFGAAAIYRSQVAFVLELQMKLDIEVEVVIDHDLELKGKPVVYV